MTANEVEAIRQRLYKKHKGYLHLSDDYIRLMMSSDVQGMALFIQQQIDKGKITESQPA